ncbi:MAG TPA: divalent-cation tolerance protein CutA [Noviherbaspirillum sp.]|uniref:divalent-cation tolerance protein CutA n=1 Tax=Noviherbaspirillum sp. TaxID=1926288 RepID=UPI002B48C587|nr:divalent-cation tolerance protein CutA [Noviherbaspirillum sp.]HJV87813.1 divalent-cation tolerance protein CutA [Noviherbaspirillum sp.]
MTNIPDEAVAHALAHRLVERRLAACVNVLPAVRSIYQWQGAIEEAVEVTMLAKTTPSRYPELEAEIRAGHPYEVPEIIALPIVAGLPAYLGWIASETRKDTNV